MVKLKEPFKAFRDTWTACILSMVQGDLSVVTLDHAMTASKVGIISFLGVALCMLVKSNPNPWFTAWVIGVLTVIGDYIVHPAHFPGEAFVAGLGAFILSIFFRKVRV